MEGLSGLPPEYLIVVCKFTYASGGRTKYLPNDIRRFLAGEEHQFSVKKRPGLPEKIAKKFGSKILIPLYFSLIKHPIEVEGRKFNAAVGAIMVYRLTVMGEEKFKQVCSNIYSELKEHSKYFKGFHIIAGYEVEVDVER